MDQPYSRVADALLDHQYWSPEDPQKTPYDDTGWTFGELYGVQVARVTDAKILQAAMERITELQDRKSTRLNSSHSQISYPAFCLKEKGSIPIARSTHLLRLIRCLSIDTTASFRK